MLTKEEILRKVKALEIKSMRLTQHMFTGEYHSAFKGQGMRFSEVRAYQPGDDIRFIDWNVSARLSHPYSKVFEEERELSVFLLLDNSASMQFGTKGNTKKGLATEIAAVLAFSAVNNNDKVGALLYGNDVQKYFVPQKGKQHALYLLREMLANEAAGDATNFKAAFRYLSRVARRRSICFVLSDFYGQGYEDAIRIAAAKHDVIGLKIYDLADMQLPDAGLIHVKDAETGATRVIDTSNAVVRHDFEKQFHRHNAYVTEVFQKAGADLLHIRTDEDYVKVLQKFFLNRTRKT